MIEDGYTMVKVPKTPSCLFDSLALAILGNLNSKEIKKNIARSVRANPIFYSKMFLTKVHKTAELYAQWIVRDALWGGIPEIKIIA